MNFKKVTEKKNPKLAAWFDSTVELQLIHNCLYLAHLQSKLSSAPRLSPLGISFPSLLDPPERRYICRSPYSLSHLKTKNSHQRHSWARYQMLSLRDYSIFTDFSLKTKGRLFSVCLVLFLHFPLLLWKLGPGRNEVLGGSQICTSTATCVPEVPCSVEALAIAGHR